MIRGGGDASTDPSAERREVARQAAGYTVLSFVARAMGLVRGYVVRLLLGPEWMGVWSGLQKVLDFGRYSSAGVTDAAVREIPILAAQGREEEVEATQNCAFTYSILSSLLFGLLLVPAAGPIAGALHLGEAGRVGVMLLGGLLILQRWTNFSFGVLSAEKRFGVMGTANVLDAAIQIGLIVQLVPLFTSGIHGMIAALAASLLVTAVYLSFFRRRPFRWRWDGSRYRRMVGVGGPLLLTGVFFTAMRSVDTFVNLAGLGALKQGHYSIALMIDANLFALAALVGSVLYPRYLERYGRDRDPAGVARMVGRVAEAIGWGTGMIAGGVCLTVPWLVRLLLPAYAPGIPAMQSLVLGTLFLAVAQPFSHLAITLDRQRALMLLSLAGLLWTVGLDAAVYAAGGGIEGIAVAMSLSYFLYMTALIILAHRVAGTAGGIRIWGRILAPPLAFYMLGRVLEGWLSDGPGLLAAIVAYTAVCVAALVVLDRRLGLGGLLRPGGRKG